MKRALRDQIFAACPRDGFVGRTAELERILGHAAGESNTKGLAILAAPGSGVSEILRQAYDRLFAAPSGLIPFYFEVRASDGDAHSAAIRFLREFLLQTVAFRRQDTTILDSSPEICEIAELAIPADGYWIDRLIETCHSESKLNDGRSFVRNCLSAPLRAAANNARSFVMIDGLHTAATLNGGAAFVEDLIDIFARSSTPYVFAGLRRFMFALTDLDTVAVDKLSFADAGRLVESLSAKTGVAINDQTRDLIAVQLDGNIALISSLFASAAEKGASLDSFGQVEKVYTDDMFGGRIGRYFDATFDKTVPDQDTQTAIIKLLSEGLNTEDKTISISYWKKHLGLNAADLKALLGELDRLEIINVAAGSVKSDAANTALGDFVDARVRLANGGSRALVVGETLAANIRRAPMLMAHVYRQNSAIGLRKLLQSFDGRQISPALIDYGKFAAELKGADDEKVLKSVKEDNDKIALPQIVYTADASAFYPQLADIAGAGRSAVALGSESEGDEVAIIAAEIDSKLEATRELTEFWCDRLEMAAVHCNFANYKIWLVAPEGFAPDAVEVLNARRAHGSSRKQALLLAQMLNADVSAADTEVKADEYEITVPMGDDTEMIAAHTIEDIAKRHNFPAKAINQIKTALVEACINATEHSLSPDRKIYQRFVVDEEKIVITIANRGLRLVDKKAVEVTPTEGRRGWGLKLMKGLMDDVRIEQSDDGTRITMTKFIKSA